MFDIKGLGPAVLVPPTKASKRQWKRAAHLARERLQRLNLRDCTAHDLEHLATTFATLEVIRLLNPRTFAGLTAEQQEAWFRDRALVLMTLGPWQPESAPPAPALGHGAHLHGAPE